VNRRSSSNVIPNVAPKLNADAVLPAQRKGAACADHGKNYRDRRFYRRTESTARVLCALRRMRPPL